MNKQELKARLKIACAKSGITQIQFVKKYYGNIIPVSSGMNGWKSVYTNIMNTLGENDMGKVQTWLIEAIEAEEMENENRKH